MEKDKLLKLILEFTMHPDVNIKTDYKGVIKEWVVYRSINGYIDDLYFALIFTLDKNDKCQINITETTDCEEELNRILDEIGLLNFKIIKNEDKLLKQTEFLYPKGTKFKTVTTNGSYSSYTSRPEQYVKVLSTNNLYKDHQSYTNPNIIPTINKNYKVIDRVIIEGNILAYVISNHNNVYVILKTDCKDSTKFEFDQDWNSISDTKLKLVNGGTYVFEYNSGENFINRIKDISDNSCTSIFLNNNVFNYCDSYEKKDVKIRKATNNESDWMNRCIDANKFVPKVDNSKFIEGKWYKLNNNWYGKTNKHIRKNTYSISEKITNGLNAKYYKCDNFHNYINLVSRNAQLLTDLSEIQKYLPDGHVDKIIKKSIKKWSVGSYVVFLKRIHSSLPIGSIDLIKKDGTSSDSYIILEKYDLLIIDREKKGEIKWFATKEEAEQFSLLLLSNVSKPSIDTQVDFGKDDFYKSENVTFHEDIIENIPNTKLSTIKPLKLYTPSNEVSKVKKRNKVKLIINKPKQLNYGN